MHPCDCAYSSALPCLLCLLILLLLLLLLPALLPLLLTLVLLLLLPYCCWQHWLWHVHLLLVKQHPATQQVLAQLACMACMGPQLQHKSHFMSNTTSINMFNSLLGP